MRTLWARQSDADGSARRRRWRDRRLLAGLLACAVVVVVAVAGQTSPRATRTPGAITTESVVSTPASALPVPQDGGPPLTITAGSLVFDQKAVTVPVTTTATAAMWTVFDEDNHLVDTGAVDTAQGSGSIDLNVLGPGYYTLAVSVGAVPARTTRVTGLAVLGALPANAAGGDSPFGVGMHVTSPSYQGVIPTVAQIGFTHARFDMAWDAVEKSKGSYTFPANYDAVMDTFRRNGITPLPIADYRNPLYDGGKTPSSPAGLAAFAAYSSAVLRHYADATSDIEVYNEPNLPRFNNSTCGVTPECYLRMLQAVYPRVKADHPNATVVGFGPPGVLMDWTQRLIELGGLADVDVVSMHPYVWPKAPETMMPWLTELRRSIRDHNGGHDKPIWLTEMGWPTYEGGTSESQQADDVIRAEALAFANGVSSFFWYDLIDDGTDPGDKEDHFGLLRQPAPGVKALGPKPSLVTQAVMIRQIAGRPCTGQDALPAPAYSVRFSTGADTTRVMWSTQPRVATLSASGPITVADEYGRSRTLAPVAGVVLLNLDEHPEFVTGPVSGIRLS